MSEALVVSNVLLWIAVLVLGALVLALLRQIGVLHERVAPAGALVSQRGPVVGERAPVLEVTDWNGAPLRAVKCFCQLLQDRYYEKLDEEADEFIGEEIALREDSVRRRVGLIP